MLLIQLLSFLTCLESLFFSWLLMSLIWTPNKHARYIFPAKNIIKSTFISLRSNRLQVVPHFSSGIVERAKRERAWKSPHARKGDTRRGERKIFLSSRRVSRKNGGLLVVYVLGPNLCLLFWVHALISLFKKPSFSWLIGLKGNSRCTFGNSLSPLRDLDAALQKLLQQ